MKKVWIFLFLSINLSQNFNISGFITDSTTGESVIGANVFLEDTDYGSITDIDGYFILLNIPQKNYTLVISYLGYEKIKQNILINENKELKFELIPKPLSVDEITVSEELLNRKKNFQTSRIKLNTIQLRNIPQVAEADLFRSLQSLPGILTQNDFSTGLVIRGSNTDQNLILLDGITVYNPSHVGGVFSNFILDAIKEVDLQKSGYNAEYGGRLSSVLKVTSREGNSKKFKSSTSISALSAQAIVEGPIKNGAWIFAGRRTYFDQIFKGTDFYFPYFFYDLQSHIYQDINSRHRISLSIYQGEDNLNWEDEFGIEAIWKNNTISLNYRIFHSQQLLSNWMLAKSKFDIFTGLGRNSSQGIVEKDYIDDVTFRNDWIVFLPQDRQLNFGFEVKDLRFYYNSSDNGDPIFNVDETPIESALYFKNKLLLNDKLLIQPGVRLNHYSNLPTKWYLDPRLQIKYFINDNRYFNISLGKYHQFMSTIQDDFNPKVIDAWFATDASVKPGSSEQLTIGVEQYLSNDIYIQSEVYYKKLNNMLTFVDQRATVNETSDYEDFTVIDSLVDLSDGYAYGWEFFIQKKTGRLNGWMNYTYSVARKLFNDMEYYTNWDRTHTFNILGNYQLSDKWNFNFKWTYQTGQPYTPIIGYYVENFPPSEETYEVIPGGRNSERFKDYHRLDFGAVRHYKLKKCNIDLFIQIINLYNQENPFTHDYIFGDSQNGVDDDGNEIIDDASEDLPIKRERNGFPLLPSIGVKIDF